MSMLYSILGMLFTALFETFFKVVNTPTTGVESRPDPVVLNDWNATFERMKRGTV